MLHVPPAALNSAISIALSKGFCPTFSTLLGCKCATPSETRSCSLKNAIASLLLLGSITPNTFEGTRTARCPCQGPLHPRQHHHHLCSTRQMARRDDGRQRVAAVRPGCGVSLSHCLSVCRPAPLCPPMFYGLLCLPAWRPPAFLRSARLPPPARPRFAWVSSALLMPSPRLSSQRARACIRLQRGRQRKGTHRVLSLVPLLAALPCLLTPLGRARGSRSLLITTVLQN